MSHHTPGRENPRVGLERSALAAFRRRGRRWRFVGIESGERGDLERVDAEIDKLARVEDGRRQDAELRHGQAFKLVLRENGELLAQRARLVQKHWTWRARAFEAKRGAA